MSMSTDPPDAAANRSYAVVRDASDVERWSEGLVSVLEAARFDVFRAGVVLVLLAAIGSAVLLPTRESVHGPALTVALAASGATIAAAVFVLVRPGRLDRVLSDSSGAQWVIVVIATAQISAVLPLHSQLWVPACALLSLLGAIVPLRRTILFCIVALSGNLLAHILVGDLTAVPPIAVLGLWEGIPFWTVLFSTATSLMVWRVIGLYVQRTDPPDLKLVRVPAWAQRTPLQLPARTTPPAAIARRLTHKQLEVFVLLMAGRKQGEIAIELGIQRSRVSRLIDGAVKRTKVANKYALEGMLALEWWGTGSASRLRAHQPQLRLSEAESSADGTANLQDFS
jgi:DNA-binding CsgD family transcriptional regulator